jgi:hypothetical protein
MSVSTPPSAQRVAVITALAVNEVLLLIGARRARTGPD